MSRGGFVAPEFRELDLVKTTLLDAAVAVGVAQSAAFHGLPIRLATPAERRATVVEARSALDLADRELRRARRVLDLLYDETGETHDR